MSFPTLLLVALGLGMDAFAVSIAAGLSIKRLKPEHVLRISCSFGLFQAGMPILGWLAGTSVASYIAAWDHWVAMALLGIIGGKMLLEARSAQPGFSGSDPTRGWQLMTLSIATSIDALAVGLSLAMLQTSIWKPSAVIGVAAAAMSAIGIIFGSRLGHRWGRWAQLVGGLVLIGIGVQIVITHLLGA